MDSPVKSSERADDKIFSMKDFKFDFKDPQFLGLIVSVLTLFLTLVLIKLWLGQRSARRGVLFLGLSDAGKTLLWSRLLHCRHFGTHTSIKENVGDYQTNKGTLKLVDIPGHERQRMKFFDQYKSSTRGAIFVIDALTFQKDIRDVAEYLFNIFTDGVIIRNKPAFLVLAHKQDQAMAKGSALIQTNLEKELNLLRDTKEKQLGSLSDKNAAASYLGKAGKDFTFAQLGSFQIEFAETSALTDDLSGLEPVKVWLATIL